MGAAPDRLPRWGPLPLMDLGPLGDRYQIVRQIGRGTTTTVLEAWERLGSRRVALKVPIASFAGDEAFLERLQREVRAVAGFAHANVAAVHALERAGGAAFVVVELVDGSNLRDMLGERGPMPPAGAARVAAGVCAAVAAAHARGIAHGHLVAANVLLTIDGRVKVTDFRLAQAALAAGDPADPAGDIRALGRLLAAMLTGREPAGAGAVRPGPEVPAELATVVARATGAGHDVQAYRSAGELGRDLARFLAAAHPGVGGATRRDPAPVAPRVLATGSSPAARRVAAAATGSPDRPAAGGAPSSLRRRRRLALLAGLATVGLVAGVLAGAGFADREPARITAGNAAAPPSATVATTTSWPASIEAAATTAPASTRPRTTAAAAATPPTTTARDATPAQRVVPDVVGLHRQRAAGVLAKAQLGVQVQQVPVDDAGKVQRVISQQPSAGQLVPARTEVVLLVGSRRKTG
jgi:tRNA A-37 threonylcarbamoyl transferase component Bud32